MVFRRWGGARNDWSCNRSFIIFVVALSNNGTEHKLKLSLDPLILPGYKSSKDSLSSCYDRWKGGMHTRQNLITKHLDERWIEPCSDPVQRLTAVASLHLSFDELHIDPNQSLSASYSTLLFADNDLAADVLNPTLSSSSDKYLQEDPNRSSYGGLPVYITNDFDDLIIPLPWSNHAVYLKPI
ncbi:hypothetical protein GJ496_009469 [Pomphorhynchus laevis]|nr:hypothetical protein GJ496_009469 [Pomphorhynchus laevis]